ncbi:MAG: ABC transporter permease [Candidatus Sumerlaeia bacterium]
MSEVFSFFPVFKRELKQYLHSPGTYVSLAFFFFLSGAMFIGLMWEYADLSAQVASGTPLPESEVPLNINIRVISQMFSLLNFLMLFLMPVLTMRLVAEERRSGSFELLVTTPLGDWDILLGKFLAALCVGIGVLALCGIYPAICAWYSNPEAGVIAACMVGLFLIITAYAAFGVFASALTDSQITAAVISFVGLLIFHLVQFFLKSGRLGSIGSHLSIHFHSQNFTRGVLAFSDVIYFIAFAFFFLFMAAQTLDARKYR